MRLFRAKGKNVIVIGGGDTGSDCIGTSNRQGAKSVVNFEIMPKPPKERSSENPWPYWPFTLKSSSSHEEGSDRKWSILTKEFITNNNGELTGLKTVEVKWEKTEDLKISMESFRGFWESDNSKEFELHTYVGNVYNRLVMYPAKYWHAPFNAGWGHDKESGRLVQVCFFTTERS